MFTFAGDSEAGLARTCARANGRRPTGRANRGGKSQVYPTARGCEPGKPEVGRVVGGPGLGACQPESVCRPNVERQVEGTLPRGSLRAHWQQARSSLRLPVSVAAAC